MKVKTVIAAVLFAGLTATAQDKIELYPTVTEFEGIAPGDVFEIPFNLDNTVLPASMQVSITMPDGFSVQQNAKKKYLIQYSDRLDTDIYETVCGLSDTDNRYTIIIYERPEYNNEESEQWYIQPDEGWFLTWPIKVADDMPDGTYTLEVTNVKAVTRDVTLYTSPNADITVTIGQPETETGIEAVSEADAYETEYYTLTGIRVPRPTTGLYIKRTGPHATVEYRR